MWVEYSRQKKDVNQKTGPIDEICALKKFVDNIRFLLYHHTCFLVDPANIDFLAIL